MYPKLATKLVDALFYYGFFFILRKLIRINFEKGRERI